MKNNLIYIFFQIYLPICRLKRKVISLNTFEHEYYKPAYYDEVKCLKPHHYYDMTDNSNNVCIGNSSLEC
jgi:hypothetical protein